MCRAPLQRHHGLVLRTENPGSGPRAEIVRAWCVGANGQWAARRASIASFSTALPPAAADQGHACSQGLLGALVPAMIYAAAKLGTWDPLTRRQRCPAGYLAGTAHPSPCPVSDKAAALPWKIGKGEAGMCPTFSKPACTAF